MRRYRTKHGQVELPNELDEKIGKVMNLLGVSAQNAVTFILSKTIDVAIESLLDFEANLSPKTRKIFSKMITQKYSVEKSKEGISIKKMKQNL